jgi:Nif-specific regulatory protein
MVTKKNVDGLGARSPELCLIADISGIMLDGGSAIDGIPKMLEKLNGYFGFPRSMITILNRKTGKISIKEACGVSDEERERGVYSLGEGIIGRVIESGEPIVVDDIHEDARFLNRTGFREVGGSGYSFICAPIKSGPETIGALGAFARRRAGKDLSNGLDILIIAATILFHAVHRYQAREEELQMLRSENQRLNEELAAPLGFSGMIGNSKRMQGLSQLIAKLATSDATVLILGESGVGKSLVAQAIHDASPRRGRPFVKLNCAALSETIIESELFGHERGAFTGAMSRRQGRFESAGSGSIFLDEIGEIGLNVQAKLLRALQEREFERVGGNETLHAECRIIAATNKDLAKKVAEGSFREDLFYRLNVFPVTVPPLRERKPDIILLADRFVERFNERGGRQIKRISTPAIDMLMAYHWPGNVRELENAIEHAMILAEDDTIHGYNLPASLQMAEPHVKAGVKPSPPGSLAQKLAAMEYEMIVEALKLSCGRVSGAAKILGMTERALGIRIDKYSIDFKAFKRK